jgi:amino acid transporter
MVAARPEDVHPRRRRPLQTLAIALVCLLLIVAGIAALVAFATAAENRRSERAPWARPGAPEVRPQPLDEQ